jgi:hypothetical protein
MYAQGHQQFLESLTAVVKGVVDQQITVDPAGDRSSATSTR